MFINKDQEQIIIIQKVPFLMYVLLIQPFYVHNNRLYWKDSTVKMNGVIENVVAMTDITDGCQYCQ